MEAVGGLGTCWIGDRTMHLVLCTASLIVSYMVHGRRVEDAGGRNVL